MTELIDLLDISFWETTLPNPNGGPRIYVADWDKISKGTIEGRPVRGIVFRMLYGTWLDISYDKNCYNAIERGYPTSTYAWYLQEQSYITQANAYAHHRQRFAHKLPPVADIECVVMSRSTIRKDVRRYLLELEKNLGTKPWIYTADWWWDDNMRFWKNYHYVYPSWVEEYTFYVAAYGPWKTLPDDRLPKGVDRRRIMMWQRSDKGIVPGFTGNVDVNWFLGSESEFSSLGGDPVHPPTFPRTAVVVAEVGVNVRSGPGSSYKRLYSMPNGHCVSVYSVSSDNEGNAWFHIHETDDLWCCKSFRGLELVRYQP